MLNWRNKILLVHNCCGQTIHQILHPFQRLILKKQKRGIIWQGSAFKFKLLLLLLLFYPKKQDSTERA